MAKLEKFNDIHSDIIPTDNKMSHQKRRSYSLVSGSACIKKETIRK